MFCYIGKCINSLLSEHKFCNNFFLDCNMSFIASIINISIQNYSLTNENV